MTTKYWRLTTGGTWSTATNWSTSSGGPANTTAPAVGDDLIFDQGATYTVTISVAPNQLNSISIRAGAVTISHGTLAVQSITWTISSGASLTHSFTTGRVGVGNGGGTSGFYHNYGTVVISGTTSTSPYQHYGGSFNNYGGASFSITHTGTTGQQMYLLAAPDTGCDFNNAGTFTGTANSLASTGCIIITGNYNNTGSVTFNYGNAASGIQFYALKSNNTLLFGSTTFNMGNNINTAIQLGASPGGTNITLLDSFTITRGVNLVGSIVDLNGKTITCNALSIQSISYAKGFTFNGGSIYMTAAGAAFTNNTTSAQSASFGANAGTGTGYMCFTNASAKTFSSASAGAGFVYPCVIANSGGALTLSLSTASCTFGGFYAFGGYTGIAEIILSPATAQLTQYITNPGIMSGSAGGSGGYGCCLYLHNTTANLQIPLSWNGSGNPPTTNQFLRVKDILFMPQPTTDGTSPFVWFGGYHEWGGYTYSGSYNLGNVTGMYFLDSNPAGVAYNKTYYSKIYTMFTNSFWSTPTDFNPDNNFVAVYGAGGGGGGASIISPAKTGAGGGGGGGWSGVYNYKPSISTSDVAYIPSTLTSDGNYGVFFNGSNYITASSSTSLAIGTGDYTFECWFYKNVSTRVMLLAIAGAGLSISINTSGNIEVNRSLTAIDFTFTAGIVNNTWYHIAVTRTGTSLRAFLNGTLLGTQSSSTSYGQGICYIGVDADASSTKFTGYISNLRVVKGAALYTTGFNPPTSPLTKTSQGATSTQVALLACQSSTIIDNSAYAGGAALTLTNNNTCIAVAKSPFREVNSIIFNGSTTYLSANTKDQYEFSAGDFTIECWVYPTAYGSDLRIFSYNDNYNNSTPGSNPVPWYMYHNSSSVNFVITDLGTLSSTSPLSLNAWSHVAVVRSGWTFYLYINGICVGSLYAYGAIRHLYADSNSGLVIGTQTYNGYPNYGNWFVGYISNIRMVANKAVYDVPFANTTSLTTTSQSVSSANVALLACQSSSVTTDNSTASPKTIVAVGSPSTVAIAPYTYASSRYIYCFELSSSETGFSTAAVSYLYLPNYNPVQATATTPFTIECWVRNNTFNSYCIATNVYGNGEANWPWGTNTNDSNIPYVIGFCNGTSFNSGGTYGSYPYFASYRGSGTSSWTTHLISPTACLTDTWYHFAVSYDGTTLKLFIDGIMVTSLVTATPSQTSTTSTSGFYIGRNFQSPSTGGTYNWNFNGAITDFRFVQGVGVYTGTFTPPTAQLTKTQSSGTNISAITQDQTKLLTCQTEYAVDYSTYNNRITNYKVSPQLTTKFTAPSSTPYIYSPFNASSYAVSFDGSTQYLRLDGSNPLGMPTIFGVTGTGDFTIECWVYLNTITSDATLIDFRAAGQSLGAYITIYVAATTGVVMAYTGAGVALTGKAIRTKKWNHIALVRLSGTTILYVNGGKVASDATSYSHGVSGNRPLFGAYLNGSLVITNALNGYMSNIRFCSTALYTKGFKPGAQIYSSNMFTVPTEPLKSTQNAGADGSNIQAIVGTQTGLLINNSNTSDSSYYSNNTIRIPIGVSIGAGGTPGVANYNGSTLGTTGGSTSIGHGASFPQGLITATGGGGGSSTTTTSTGGTGGTAASYVSYSAVSGTAAGTATGGTGGVGIYISGATYGHGGGGGGGGGGGLGNGATGGTGVATTSTTTIYGGGGGGASGGAAGGSPTAYYGGNGGLGFGGATNTSGTTFNIGFSGGGSRGWSGIVTAAPGAASTQFGGVDLWYGIGAQGGAGGGGSTLTPSLTNIGIGSGGGGGGTYTNTVGYQGGPGGGGMVVIAYTPNTSTVSTTSRVNFFDFF